MRALQIAATGMSAQQMRVEVISNNLANMSTTGYNARRAEFADLMYQQATRPGTITANDGTIVPAGVQIGLGVRSTAVSITLAQGPLASTGGDLDLAIDGYGFLEVTLPSGASAYTRDGGLKRSADGQIVTSDGYPVVPGITLPDDATTISINAAGEVYAYFTNQVQPQLLGQITLAGFTNEKGLEAIGSNLFLETEASGAPTVAAPGTDGLGVIKQGYLEESSVDAVREITELIKAQRGYEMNAKVITAADEMLQATTQVR
ncbi:flagellar basal-body rod protein FlgG [Rhodobacter capsulatus]|jgi:flagellar basal-body rod protein FlgG|uniref:Flagellar basal-body rod protein FlgG n=1 Tax=Rhodobacter capsulatus (strain ATCC BAA-309 / NBRC 16581 / SB1003) TaxID=272942 RepID=D5ASZ8_RHOCB|nr:flagellar basal-body rod protein FlgG [Rhodobacter capsulatus]ADE87239.1 flagellar basal-body rod protein FlgG [Rhodobacter capsulatus SB 1003]ETD03463.1 flagellar basal body rod protein FlgG [Rhodobacter capsulatus DE442]ETD78071.1 flagellar basal body rod protein FlgG [Rhodobacter capsulatus B6]ETD80257.1 flagellar basal body rod protein FlgG [Rhodobacter capsulatus R121]ETD82747.1 flagellar basal body rod protein FlgG [Rhodobacter capsulatus YW1]